MILLAVMGMKDQIPFPFFFLMMLLTLPQSASATLAGVVGGRLRVSPEVQETGNTLEEFQENTLPGHTVFIYNILLSENDLAYLSAAIRRKTSSLAIFNHREWNKIFWSPIIENGHFYNKISNLVIYNITDFIYMRQLLCKAKVYVVSVCFESLDALLRSSKII